MKVKKFNLKQDYRKIRDLVQESFMVSTDFGVGALDYTLFMESEDEMFDSMLLWENIEGQVVAMGWAGTQNLNFVVHPQYRELEVDIIDHFEKSFSEFGRNEIRTESFENDQFKRRVLEKKGYVKIDSSYHYFAKRSLVGIVPDVDLPSGFRIRSLDTSDKELGNRVKLNEYSADRMSVDQYRKMTNALSYRNNLDLVVVKNDDEAVAFCTIWFDEKNKCGLVEPIGTHPNYRRKGLGRELLYEGMRRLKKYGASDIYVSTDPVVLNGEDESEPARRLYESVGFKEVDRGFIWRKNL